MSDQKWVRGSLAYLAHALQKRGYEIEQTTVRRLLKKLDYGLFGNRKSLSPRHPDQDKQFRFIRRVRKVFMAAGQPVISVDTKKKELLGSFFNHGQQWCLNATAVNTHDFPSYADGKAIPYGIYDMRHNLGYVAVGKSADTPEFAVDAIVWWWQHFSGSSARTLNWECSQFLAGGHM